MGKLEKIRHTIAWMQAHLLRAEQASNAAIAARHEQLTEKYFKELADLLGYKVSKK